MNKLPVITLIIAQSLVGSADAVEWKAQRITDKLCQNRSNTWLNFRKDIRLDRVPEKAVAQIACDSKYWLWINGEIAVYEGLLKRGPTPQDTYYDEVDLAPFLKPGNNSIAVLVWYFGKDGFSHNSSGAAGLAFQCDAIGLYSDGSWRSRLDPAFEDTRRPHPNFRLPESNIRFDANYGNFLWTQPKGKLRGFINAKVIGSPESSPWNKLVLRPIPQWKDFGIREYENRTEIPAEGTGEWVVCTLPYNLHASPILDIEAPKGLTIEIITDNYEMFGPGREPVRAEYVTRQGRQQYESLGWMNGHEVKYRIPKGVKIHSLTYRETGFDCELSGHFSCSDPYYEELWKKAVRTLYVTMRDTYMDCPDRERALWWGDAVNECGEAFYALSPSAATITKKGILELINWQREDDTLYSPIPEGNWDRELPGQMLASVGYYGFWNYYQNTGDKDTIASVLKGVRRYLDVWTLKPDGTLVERHGDWYWGDWGKQVDKQLLFNGWFYLALKGYLNMAVMLGEQQEVSWAEERMSAFKQAFNTVFWDGSGYRTQAYEGRYDDRAQALAVVSGLADEAKYPPLLKVFKTSFLASPYMEKYVLEALFVMGEAEYGLERMKNRYRKMVESKYTTLYENFGDGADRSGYGTNNHAWSGGGLTVLAQYVCGLEPIDAAWKTFRVRPQLGTLKYAETGNETVAGKVAVKAERTDSGMTMQLTVPAKSEAVVCVPEKYTQVRVNDVEVFKERFLPNTVSTFEGDEDRYRCFRVKGGTYTLQASAR